MNDFFPLFGQSAVVAMEAAWLTVAVFDNIRYPHLNERGFARVLGMDLVKQQDPEVYADVSDRRVENPRMEKNPVSLTGRSRGNRFDFVVAWRAGLAARGLRSP